MSGLMRVQTRALQPVLQPVLRPWPIRALMRLMQQGRPALPPQRRAPQP
jgi:hypothetical protein